MWSVQRKMAQDAGEVQLLKRILQGGSVSVESRWKRETFQRLPVVLSPPPVPYSGSVEPSLGEGSEFSGCLYFQFFLFTFIEVMSFKAIVCCFCCCCCCYINGSM